MKRGETKGAKHPGWKEELSYGRIHKWMNKEFGHPSKCEFCATSNAKAFEWSNKTHTYKRNRDDWQYLCRKCHKDYDRTTFGITGGRKKQLV